MSVHLSPIQRAVRAAFAAAAVGASFFVPAAHAQVVVANFTAAPITIPFNIDGLYINVVTGVTGTTGGSVPGWDINPYFVGTGVGGIPGFNLFSTTTAGSAYVGTGTTATALMAGAVVGPASTFATVGPLGTGPAASGIQYFGFRFLNGTGVTATTHYGYAMFDRTLPVAAGSVRLLGYAFEATPLAPITVSAIPEPTTWLMMLGGLAAVGAAIRKRAA
jgi:hypothetical protein